MYSFVLLLIGVVAVIGGIVGLRLHAFLALLGAAILVSLLTPRERIESALLAQKVEPAVAAARAKESLGVKLANRFGNTCTQLGLVIAMASIVGATLLESGGAQRIVRSTLGLFGEKRSPLVFASSGYVLGVPVFFDTVFLLLIPLARAMALRTQRNYLLYVLAIAVGTTMTHSLVPPTPGPLLAANQLKVPLGMMMIGGLVISAFAAMSGLAFAYWANRRWPIPVRPLTTTDENVALAVAERPDAELPPIWLALAPIVLPVVLISLQTFATMPSVVQLFTGAEKLPAGLAGVLATLGNPTIALSLAAMIGLATVAWQKRGNAKAMRSTVQGALADAGVIILITAAGGVFGGVLQETGIGQSVQALAKDYRIAVLPLAFLVTAIIRSAQGSATVAMVTAVGVLQAFAAPEVLGFHPLYLALVIGCASKIFPWMNDSGFWVICKTSGLTEKETLRSIGPMFSIMGVTGSIVVMIAAKLLPLV